MSDDPKPFSFDRLVAAFAAADCVGCFAARDVDTPFFYLLLMMLFAAQLTLLAAWWALGLTEYRWRFWGTAAAIGLGIPLFTLLLLRNDLRGGWNIGYSDVWVGIAIVILQAASAVGIGGCGFFVLRICGLRRYRVDDPPQEPARWLQFTLMNLIQTTTTAALFAAGWGILLRHFEVTSASDFLRQLLDPLVILGCLMVVGIGALLVTLTPSPPGRRIPLFFAVLVPIYWLSATYFSSEFRFDFLASGMFEAVLLVGALAVVRQHGFRVTWRRASDER